MKTRQLLMYVYAFLLLISCSQDKPNTDVSEAKSEVEAMHECDCAMPSLSEGFRKSNYERWTEENKIHCRTLLNYGKFFENWKERLSAFLA